MAENIRRRRGLNGVEIFNTETNRWVKEQGSSGNNYITRNLGAKYGNANVKSGTPYIELRPRTNNGWTEIAFERADNLGLPTVRKMINVILKQVKPNRSDIYVDNYYSKDDGDKTTRSTKLIGLTPDEFYDILVNRVTLSRDGAIPGTDVVDNEYEIFTGGFKIKFKKLDGGGQRDKYSTIKTQYYKSRSFKCNEGDCLLAILVKDLRTIPRIRKELKLSPGSIDISEVPNIEKYFEANIDIIEDKIEIIKSCIDTEKKNITHISYSRVYLYKSNNNYSGDAYDILLKDNHYSLIMEDLDLKFDKVCGDILIKNKNFEYVELNDNDRKKSLMKQGRKIAGQKIDKRNKIQMLLFFDIETIFNIRSKNVLETYSVSWWVREDDPAQCPSFSERNIGKYVNQCMIEYGADSMEKFIRWIEDNDETEDSIINFVLIGYNNSRFDNFPLLNGVIAANMFSNMLFVQNSVLKMTFFNRHITWDLCRFVMCKLKDACQDFNAYPKKMEGFSHYEPQDAFMKNGWNGLDLWIDENKKLLTKYNKYDVLATASLFFIVRKEYDGILELDILKYTTLASTSYARFIKIKEYPTPAPIHEGIDKYLRNGLTGGRNQKFIEEYLTDEKLFCVDVKSLYPYVMMNRPFPIGDYEVTLAYRPYKLGFYNCKIIKQPIKKIIPMRSDEKSLDWEYDTEFNHFLTSVEIECIRRHKGVVDILPINDEKLMFEMSEKLNFMDKNQRKEIYRIRDMVGIFWPKDTNMLFNSYFGELSDMKTQQDILRESGDREYNPALRNILKLILNSLSGKMVQRNFSTTVEMIKNNNEEEKLREKSKEGSIELIYSSGEYALLKGELKDDRVYRQRYAKPSQLGVFIYAHSRVYMYDMVYSNYNVLYTDTDSAIMHKKDYYDFSKKFIVKKGTYPHEFYVAESKGSITTIGGNFGQFEEEFSPGKKNFESYILGKKVYCVEMTIDGKIDKKSKYRMKGVNLDTDCVISKEEAEEINNMPRDEASIRILYKKYKKCLAEKNTEKIAPFRELNKNGECYFFCSRLIKQKLMMQQTFTTKKISFNSITGDAEIDK